MGDKIEVGEYVRTKSGIIFKFEWFEQNDYCPNFELGEKGKSFEFEDEEELKEFMNNDIVKHSKNIIDLIEVGDYVNGMLVTTIINMDENGNYIPCRIILCNRDGDCTLPPLKIYEKDIKSIVTKESFASIEYKI